MSASLWILDGLVILTFFVAWAESSTSPDFRLTPFRWLRAVSIPCAVIWLFHFASARGWFEAISQSVPRLPKGWFWELVFILLSGPVLLLLMALVVWSIMGLLVLISTQFTGWNNFFGKRKP